MKIFKAFLLLAACLAPHAQEVSSPDSVVADSARPLLHMVTLQGSGMNSAGRSVGYFKMYGICEVATTPSGSPLVPMVPGVFSEFETNQTRECRADRWVGPLGISLKRDMDLVPSAHAQANAFQKWSYVKLGSIILVPVFLSMAVSGHSSDPYEDEPRRKNLTKQWVFLGLTGAAFGGWIAGNIGERIKLRRARDAWNRARPRALPPQVSQPEPVDTASTPMDVDSYLRYIQGGR